MARGVRPKGLVRLVVRTLSLSMAKCVPPSPRAEAELEVAVNQHRLHALRLEDEVMVAQFQNLRVKQGKSPATEAAYEKHLCTLEKMSATFNAIREAQRKLQGEVAKERGEGGA